MICKYQKQYETGVTLNFGCYAATQHKNIKEIASNRIFRNTSVWQNFDESLNISLVQTEGWASKKMLEKLWKEWKVHRKEKNCEGRQIPCQAVSKPKQ